MALCAGDSYCVHPTSLQKRIKLDFWTFRTHAMPEPITSHYFVESGSCFAYVKLPARQLQIGFSHSATSLT